MLRLPVLAALLTLAAAPASAPQWPFPGTGPGTDAPANTQSAAPPPGPDVVRLPGSAIAYRHADFHDMARAIDWFPDSHPAAPDVVIRRAGEVALACGYCHLPDGRGRPENARLQGLPASYIVEQVNAFAAGTRRAARPDYAPTGYMTQAAHALSPADLTAAATYFSQFEPLSHTRVVETATIQAATPWHFVYRFDATRTEPLGQRIVEGPDDPERFELRDPETAYTAYVPVGALKRGAVIASGTAGAPACASCHGQSLVGIAGASPTFLARQLMGFRAKTRNDPGAAPMQAVAANLTDAQIIDCRRLCREPAIVESCGISA